MKDIKFSVVVGLFISLLPTYPLCASERDIQALAVQIRDATQSQRIVISQGVGKVDTRLLATGKYDIDLKKEISRHVSGASRKYHLPQSLLRAIIKVESAFNPTALSKKQCYGLTQLAPATAKELGADLYDLRQNIYGGAAYFRQMYDQYGSVEKALWAYNAGPRRVDDDYLPRETAQYIQKVMKLWHQYENKAS